MPNRYRITRSDMYTSPTCAGYKNLTARQGYFVRAKDENEALDKIAQQFPHDENFTIHPA